MIYNNAAACYGESLSRRPDVSSQLQTLPHILEIHVR